jgi:ABC-type phosphate transport system auxiliary subunit
LVEHPHDQYWDGKPTRRELQKAFNKLGSNDAELMAMVDTNCLVVNYLCEKLGVTREDLEVYVAKQKEALAAMKAAEELRRREENVRSD